MTTPTTSTTLQHQQNQQHQQHQQHQQGQALLTGRQQRTVLNGEASDWAEVDSGVPITDLKYKTLH